MSKEELYEISLNTISEALSVIDEENFKSYVEGVLNIAYSLAERYESYPVMEGVH